MESSGQWLEKALLELCGKIENGLDLDAEIISGLVSYCELAPPLDAKEYLDVIFFFFPSSIYRFSCFRFCVLIIRVLNSVESP